MAPSSLSIFVQCASAHTHWNGRPDVKAVFFLCRHHRSPHAASIPIIMPFFPITLKICQLPSTGEIDAVFSSAARIAVRPSNVWMFHVNDTVP